MNYEEKWSELKVGIRRLLIKAKKVEKGHWVGKKDGCESVDAFYESFWYGKKNRI